MPRTSSILDNDWRSWFGQTLKDAADFQHIEASRIAKQIDRGAGKGRARHGDWSRWVSGERTPTEYQLRELSTALRIPEPVLRLSAGYVDDLLGCAYTAAYQEGRSQSWSHPISPRRAAFALLFGLFPAPGMYVGRRFGVSAFLSGDAIRLNTTQEEGFLTGKGWNAAWLYAEQFNKNCVVEHPPAQVTFGPFSEHSPELRPCFSLRAIAQVDIASSVAASLLALERSEIPTTSILAEVRHTLHLRSIPIPMRLAHAADLVHAWADQLDCATAEDAREKLHPWSERTITGKAAKWIRKGLKVAPPEPFWL